MKLSGSGATSMPRRDASKVTIYAALFGNVAIAVTKAAAAAITGSSAMFSEAIHSVVDTGNELLLLYGLRRSRRRPDAEHPLGYGRELYFWSFVVALLVFTVGSGASIWQGVLHLRNPEPISHVGLSYAVLLLSMLFEGSSWLVGLRALRRTKGRQGYWAAIRGSKDPPTFIVLFEDSAALCGLLIALIATFAATHFEDPRLDGVGSIAIGLLLAGVALALARRTKALLIGERADPSLGQAILLAARGESSITAVNSIVTVQLAPDQVVVALNLKFEDSLTTQAIENAIANLEAGLRQTRPEVRYLFVKPQRLEAQSAQAGSNSSAKR